jgi:hypothetical protein
VFLLIAHWTTGRGNELMTPSYGLLGRTVYGRQEFREESPEGWCPHCIGRPVHVGPVRT